MSEDNNEKLRNKMRGLLVGAADLSIELNEQDLFLQEVISTWNLNIEIGNLAHDLKLTPEKVSEQVAKLSRGSDDNLPLRPL